MGAGRSQRVGLRFHQSGAGAPVLLIAGLADDAAVWAAQISALSRTFQVTRYDARGLGESPTPPGPWGLGDLVDDAVDVLDSAGVPAAHVVGSSLGGAIAQRLAIDHPDRVLTLTLSGSWARADRAFRAVLSSWLWTAARAGSIDELLGVLDRWAFAAPAWDSGMVDEAIVAAVIAEVRAGGPESWRAFRQVFEWTAWAALQHDSTAQLPGVAARTLVLVGSEDAILPPRYSRELVELLPDARLKIIDDAGHKSFQEQPAIFNDLVREFLAPRDAIVA